MSLVKQVGCTVTQPISHPALSRSAFVQLVENVSQQIQCATRSGAGAGRSLVGVSVVVVVLDAPGLKGVDEGHEHEGAHNVLH